IDRAFLVIDLSGGFSCDIQILLGHFTRLVGVNDQQLLPAKFRRIFLPQPIADVVSLSRVVHHHEQDRLLGKRCQLLAILLPTFDTRGQIGLITRAGYVRSRLGNSVGNTIQGSLDHVVDDRLLERIVEHRPREQLPFAVARRGGEIELRSQPDGSGGMQAANDLVPFAFFIMGVVRLVVQNGKAPSSINDVVVEILDRRCLCWWLGPEHSSQFLWFVVSVALPFVELLHVREIERTERACEPPHPEERACGSAAANQVARARVSKDGAAVHPSCFETPRCARLLSMREESTSDGVGMAKRGHDRASAAPCKARVVAFPCFRPLLLSAAKSSEPRDAHGADFSFSSRRLRETRNAGLWPAACFSPVIYRKKQGRGGSPSHVAAGGADHYLTRCRRGPRCGAGSSWPCCHCFEVGTARPSSSIASTRCRQRSTNARASPARGGACACASPSPSRWSRCRRALRSAFTGTRSSKPSSIPPWPWASRARRTRRPRPGPGSTRPTTPRRCGLRARSPRPAIPAPRQSSAPPITAAAACRKTTARRRSGFASPPTRAMPPPASRSA